MKSIDEILPFLSLLIEGMAKHFGEGCEFVVHDYSKDTSTIVAIANGEVTGRSIGHGNEKIGLSVMRGTEEETGNFNTISQTPDGRFLRSSSIYLRGEENELLGLFCVNFDITELIRSRNFIEQFIHLDLNDSHRKQMQSAFCDNVDDFLVGMINESIKYVGVPVAHMTRDQKMEGINYLNRRGAFRVKNAAATAAKYYDISRYTLYNYLNDIEGTRG